MRRAVALAVAAFSLALAACLPQPSPTPSPSPRPSSSATPVTFPTASASSSVEPTPTPEPSLSLQPPTGNDPRVISVTVEHDVGNDGGEMLVTVTSTADTRIDELVLRWPTALNDVLFLAPFVPSEERIRDGGPPLAQEWTKWVIGPGEQGEPAGTISLGYGPLLPGATLQMPINVTRRQAGSVAFDLQVLAANDILTLTDGSSADVRIEIP